MRSLRLDSKEIARSLDSIMQQPYIEKYIQKPFIDFDKIIFLADICQHADMRTHEKKQFIITVMLVQSALDTHENIPTESGTGMSETEKQLSVLSGDYYSGLYYALLADLGQIDMIRVLASAIKEINEYKMTLYYEETSDFNELIYILMKMESLLITDVAKVHQMNDVYVQVIEKACLLNRLQRETIAVEKDDVTYMTVFLKKADNHASGIQLAQYIAKEVEKQKMELERLLSFLPSSFSDFREEIKEKFISVYHTTCVEEG